MADRTVLDEIAGDLSVDAAIERAAKANSDYYGQCWQMSFPDTADDHYPFWAGLTDAHRASARRSALVTIYCYLHVRSEKDPGLEAERIRLLEDIPADWRPILSKVLRVAATDLKPRTPRRAFGADLSNPQHDLLAFAWDREASAGLLLEAYRRDEIRRLEEKARLLRRGPLSDAESERDRRWFKRNCETFGVAERFISVAQEARAAAGHPDRAAQEATDAP